MEAAEEADTNVPVVKLSVQLELYRTKVWLKRQGGDKLLDLVVYNGGIAGLDVLDLDELEVVAGKWSGAELDPEVVARFLDAVADFQDALSTTQEKTSA